MYVVIAFHHHIIINWKCWQIQITTYRIMPYYIENVSSIKNHFIPGLFGQFIPEA